MIYSHSAHCCWRLVYQTRNKGTRCDIFSAVRIVYFHRTALWVVCIETRPHVYSGDIVLSSEARRSHRSRNCSLFQSRQHSRRGQRPFGSARTGAPVPGPLHSILSGSRRLLAHKRGFSQPRRSHFPKRRRAGTCSLGMEGGERYARLFLVRFMSTARVVRTRISNTAARNPFAHSQARAITAFAPVRTLSNRARSYCANRAIN